jgi:hypothetical protein
MMAAQLFAKEEKGSNTISSLPPWRRASHQLKSLSNFETASANTLAG